jgi:hypothetical protein
MSASLVIVDTTKGRRLASFNALTGESTTTIESYTELECEHFNVHQYSYHVEYGVDNYRFIVLWPEDERPLPRKDDEVQSDRDLAINRLFKQYEHAVGGRFNIVNHQYLRTESLIRLGEALITPTDLAWTTVEPVGHDPIV